MTDDAVEARPPHPGTIRFLSPDWIDALDAAARSRVAPAEDPLATVTLSIDQVILDGPRYRLSIEHGTLRVTADPVGEADLRLTSDAATAAGIASGTQPALDAFIAGDLRIGGDTTLLLDHRSALEAIGDLFAEVRVRTLFE